MPWPLSWSKRGGKASDGQQRIMEIKPTELHQRVPFYVGSKNLVEKAESFEKDKAVDVA